MNQAPLSSTARTAKRALGNVAGALVIVGLIGSVAYTIWAMFTPYAEPAASFIEWQARWGGDGRYGLKATFLATWLNIMLVAGVAFAAGWTPYYLISWARSPRTPMPSGPQWRALPTNMLRKAAIGTLFAFVPSAALYATLLTDAESLSFLGGACSIVFMLGPITAAVGILSLFNLALPRRVIVATVDALSRERDAKGNVLRHVAQIAGEAWTVSAEAWAQLQVGATVAIQAPSVTNAPITLLVQSPVHFR